MQVKQMLLIIESLLLIQQAAMKNQKISVLWTDSIAFTSWILSSIGNSKCLLVNLSLCFPSQNWVTQCPSLSLHCPIHHHEEDLQPATAMLVLNFSYKNRRKIEFWWREFLTWIISVISAILCCLNCCSCNVESDMPMSGSTIVIDDAMSSKIWNKYKNVEYGSTRSNCNNHIIWGIPNPNKHRGPELQWNTLVQKW